MSKLPFKSWEAEWSSAAPKDRYVILRLDGRSFGAYTRHLERPYDLTFMADMDAVALELCRELGGARLAYVQSDEISILLTAFGHGATQEWLDASGGLMFGGRIQKLVSVSAALASAVFNARRPHSETLGLFDSRVLAPRTYDEVAGYFDHRHYDCQKNAISMAAHTVASDGELFGMSTSDRERLIPGGAAGLPGGFRYGRLLRRRPSTVVANSKLADDAAGVIEVERQAWHIEAAPDRIGLHRELTELVPVLSTSPA